MTAAILTVLTRKSSSSQYGRMNVVLPDRKHVVVAGGETRHRDREEKTEKEQKREMLNYFALLFVYYVIFYGGDMIV